MSDLEKAQHTAPGVRGTPETLPSDPSTSLRKGVRAMIWAVVICCAFVLLSQDARKLCHHSLEALSPLFQGPTPSAIDWEPCGSGLDCGHIKVPFDYHNKTSGEASLAVIRYAATHKKRMGTIFTNPGGEHRCSKPIPIAL